MRKLRKDNEGKAVAPEESEFESEDNSDDEYTEQDHEESWHEPAPLSPRQQGGQDGRVVKAGALGDTHVKSWDRTWSSSDFKRSQHSTSIVELIRDCDSMWLA